jgi:RNA 2',3'-cyclic 3'-phosphodiesterase
MIQKKFLNSQTEMKQLRPFKNITDLHNVFLGVSFSDDARKEFVGAVKILAKYSNFLNFQKLETPHISLQFWHKVDENLWNKIILETEKVAKTFKPFEVKINSCGFFGRPDERRVLWLKPESNGEIEKIANALPFPKERPFHAHATLARIKDSRMFDKFEKEIFDELKDLQFEFTCDRICLYGAVGGENQIPLVEFPLS